MRFTVGKFFIGYAWREWPSGIVHQRTSEGWPVAAVCLLGFCFGVGRHEEITKVMLRR